MLKCVMALAVEKLWHPYLDASEPKRHRRHAKRRRQEGWIARQAKDGPALRRFLQRIKLSSLRLSKKQRNQAQRESRGSCNVEGKSPAVLRREISSQKISRRRTHRNRKIKHSQNSSALFF